MSADEKKVVQALAKAVKVLPYDKKEYLLGYAEGVAAMVEKAQEREPPHEKAG